MMDDNFIIWSLDRIKFLKTVASRCYNEKLGYMLGREWYFEMQRSEENPRTWSFYLCSSDNEVESKVEVEVVLPTGAIMQENCHFKTNVSKYRVAKLLRGNLVEDKLHFVLKFQKVIREDVMTFPLEKNPFADDVIKRPSIIKNHVVQLKELSDDFQTLLKEEHMADVTLKCHSDSFKVHKLILCARSPVFKTMFSCPMREKLTDTVLVEDMNPEVLKSMIQYMYCGQVDVKSMFLATGLLYAAEKYQVKGLKNGVTGHLKGMLCIENALQILDFEDLYGDSFKDDVVKFIGVNFSQFKHRKDWNELKLTKPALALEVYSMIAQDKFQ